MLKIKGLYKEKNNNAIKNIDIDLEQGSSIGIECSNDISDLLVNLILARETPAKGEIYIDGIKNEEYIKNNIGSIGAVILAWIIIDVGAFGYTYSKMGLDRWTIREE